MKDLFIVARTELALYDYLSQHFAGRPDVEVILDRRRGDPAVRPAIDLRRSRSVDTDLTELGFAVIVVPSAADHGGPGTVPPR